MDDQKQLEKDKLEEKSTTGCIPIVKKDDQPIIGPSGSQNPII